MDIVEFVEKHIGVELYECQKDLLRSLGKWCSMGRGRIVMVPNAGVRIYMDQKSKKELIQHGASFNRHN